MKKQLLAGTALVAATMIAAGSAVAADKKMKKPSISVNGYYEQVIGATVDESLEHVATSEGANNAKLKKATNVGKDTSAIDLQSDTEIQFNGSAHLDNGLKIAVRWELEGSADNTFNDPIDEYYLSLSGSFGQIILGGTENAPTRMVSGFAGSWATGVGENLNFDLNTWVPRAAGSSETVQHVRLSSGDGEKLTYISPKFGGVQVGFSYAPFKTNDDTNERVNAEAERHNGLAAAISYAAKFGDVGIGAGAGYLSFPGCSKCSDKNENLGSWIVSGRMDFGGGFRAAVGYKRTDDPKGDRGYLIDAGVRYTQGPNRFSLTGSHGELDDAADQHRALLASYARTLGPGVKVHVNLAYVDSQGAKNQAEFDTNNAEHPDGTLADKMVTIQAQKSGVVAIAGFQVSF